MTSHEKTKRHERRDASFGSQLSASARLFFLCSAEIHRPFVDHSSTVRVASFEISLAAKRILIDNILHFFARASPLASLRRARPSLLPFPTSVAREQAGLWKKICAMKLSRGPPRVKGIRRRVPLARKWTSACPTSSSRFSRTNAPPSCLQCLGNNLALVPARRGSTSLRDVGATLDDPLRRRLMTVFPRFSVFFSSSSVFSSSSKGNQLRVTCALAGRTRS